MTEMSRGFNFDDFDELCREALEPEIERAGHAHHFLDHVNNRTSQLVDGIEEGYLTEPEAWLALGKYAVNEAETELDI